MNFSSPAPAPNRHPRLDRWTAAEETSSSSSSSGRVRSRLSFAGRSASHTFLSAVTRTSRGNNNSGGSKKAASCSKIDDLDRSCRGAPRLLALGNEAEDPIDVLDELSSRSGGPIKIVVDPDRERSLKFIHDEADDNSTTVSPRPKWGRSLRSGGALPRDLLNDSHKTAMTASSCTLDNSLSRSGLLSISAMASAGLLTGFAAAEQEATERHVTFGTVEIRSYPLALGDNPSVSSGPPLAISWYHDAEHVVRVEVDKYESAKPYSREKCQMLVPRFTREEWLRDAGYSRGEVAEAVRAVDEVKESRRKSAASASGGAHGGPGVWKGALKDLLRLGTKRT